MANEVEIREFLREQLVRQAERKGIPKSLVTDDGNFLENGLVDSMFFLELVAAVESRYGLEVDFSDLEPGAFTTLRGLAAQCAKARAA